MGGCWSQSLQPLSHPCGAELLNQVLLSLSFLTALLLVLCSSSFWISPLLASLPPSATPAAHGNANRLIYVLSLFAEPLPWPGSAQGHHTSVLQVPHLWDAGGAGNGHSPDPTPASIRSPSDAGRVPDVGEPWKFSSVHMVFWLGQVMMKIISPQNRREHLWWRLVHFLAQCRRQDTEGLTQEIYWGYGKTKLRRVELSRQT